jgi:GAF domain-containing protein
MTHEEYPDFLLESFGELSKLLLSGETVGSTLDVIAALAVQTISGCDVASVSLVKGGTISTLGSSDEVAQELDAFQYEVGQGPCLDAVGKDAMWFQIDSMSDDNVWPAFSKRAVGKGYESLLAFTLRVDDGTLGALNLYARLPRSFTEQDREAGAIYAAHAAIALANAQTHEKDARLRHELEGALSVQQLIGKAQGILMEKEFHTADEALEILRRRAEDLKGKISASAQEVIDSAERDLTELRLPEGFEDSVLSRAQKERPLRSSRTMLVFAPVLIGILMIGLAVMAFQLVDARRETTARAEALRVLLVEEESTIQLAGNTPGPQAEIVATERGPVLVAIDLPEAPEGKTYQLWLLTDGEVVGSKTFDLVDGIAYFSLARPLTSYDQAQVTLEPAGGSQAPTTDPVLQSQ